MIINEKEEFLDDKVVFNTLMFPTLLYVLGFPYASLFMIVFYFIGYLFLINYLDFTKDKREHKKYSYISILIGIYAPALLFYSLF